MIVRNCCFLCGTELTPIPKTPGNQIHPTSDTCLVQFTDRFGIAVDGRYVQTIPEPEESSAVEDDPDIIDLNRWPRTDVVLTEAFARLDLPRLGGQSTGRGWTSIALFQKCPHAWKRRYEMAADAAARGTTLVLPESEGLAVGSLCHTYAALHYANRIGGHPYQHIKAEQIHEYCLGHGNPAFTAEAWRVWTGYKLHYMHADEAMIPLAVEHDLRDPRTNESCRYDLIAFFPDDAIGRPAGTYIVEHKFVKIFDRGTLEGWPNDGEVLGQVYAWRNLKLDLRFGELQGVLMNIVGKQKNQQFYRLVVAPSSWQLDEHGKDLKNWEGLIQLARGSRNFPRARNSCVSKFGLCELFEECATGEQ